MNDSLNQILGPAASMSYMRPGLKARQVTTHTHEHPNIPGYDRFKDVGHWDCKRIKAGESWEFPKMQGPGCVTAIWMTFAGKLIEALLRRNSPEQRYLWINVYYDGEKEPAISCPVGHFFGNGTSRYVHFDSRLWA